MATMAQGMAKGLLKGMGELSWATFPAFHQSGRFKTPTWFRTCVAPSPCQLLSWLSSRALTPKVTVNAALSCCD